MPTQRSNTPRNSGLTALAGFMFWSRWLQAPLYIGLIVAQAVYVYAFWTELVHLVQAAFGDKHAIELLVESVGYTFPDTSFLKGLSLLFQGNNMTDALFRQYQTDRNNPTDTKRYGKTYLFGANYKF